MEDNITENQCFLFHMLFNCQCQKFKLAEHVEIDKHLQKISTKASMTHIQKEKNIIQGQKAKKKKLNMYINCTFCKKLSEMSLKI